MFEFFLGWQGKVFKIRKRYDRIRERADKISDPQKRLYILKILDQTETTLVILEEERLSRVDRARMYASVVSAVEQAQMLLEEKIIPQQPAYQQVQRQ